MRDPVGGVVLHMLDVIAELRVHDEVLADELYERVGPMVVASVFFEQMGVARQAPDPARVAYALAVKLGSRGAARRAVEAVLAELVEDAA
jgi:hypothetical protein